MTEKTADPDPTNASGDFCELQRIQKPHPGKKNGELATMGQNGRQKCVGGVDHSILVAQFLMQATKCVAAFQKFTYMADYTRLSTQANSGTKVPVLYTDTCLTILVGTVFLIFQQNHSSSFLDSSQTPMDNITALQQQLQVCCMQ